MGLSIEDVSGGKRSNFGKPLPKGKGEAATPVETAAEYRYHTTSIENLKSIEQFGLRPRPGQYGKGVYFAPTIEGTKAWGSPESAMIRVKKKNLPKDYDEFPEQGWTENSVPPSAMEVSIDNGKTWSPVTAKETQLFHTTTPRAFTSINKQGFKIDVRPEDQIGRAFGDGTYFSTTKAEAQIWSEFVTNKNNGKIIDLKAKLDIFDPKTKHPATYWYRMAKEAGIKITEEDGQNIADSLMMGKSEVLDAGMTMADFTRYRELGKKIVTEFSKKHDGARFYEPMEDEGIVNPQVVIFNIDKVNQALKGRTNFGRK